MLLYYALILFPKYIDVFVIVAVIIIIIIIIVVVVTNKANLLHPLLLRKVRERSAEAKECAVNF